MSDAFVGLLGGAFALWWVLAIVLAFTVGAVYPLLALSVNAEHQPSLRYRRAEHLVELSSKHVEPLTRNVRKLGPAPLCGGTVVVAEKATDALASANGTIDTLPWRTLDELVAQPLVVSFTMVMRDEFAERTTEVPLSERNEAVEAFLFDGTDEPLP